MFPIKLHYKDFSPSEAFTNFVEEKIKRLEKFYEHIVRCDVYISLSRHHHQDNVFHIKIHLAIPNADIVVNQESEKNSTYEDIYAAFRGAYRALQRQLEDKVRIIRKDIKFHVG